MWLALGLLPTIIALQPTLHAQTASYVGSAACSMCHSGAVGNNYNVWKQTLHAKIHQEPTLLTVTGDFINKTIAMGSGFGGVNVSVRTAAEKYYVKLGTAGPEYEVTFTYGGGWKQRYLTKIDSSYYILPIQWNSNNYLDNSSGLLSYSPPHVQC